MSLQTISDTIERALRSAGLDLAHGPAKGVAGTIRRALEAAGIAQDAPRPSHERNAKEGEHDALELVERVDTPGVSREAPRTERAERAPQGGLFLDRTHAGTAGSRDYKLYVPAGAHEGALPLVVMLHGCKQNPEDFATGTRMNALADKHGFLVAYPAQSPNANGSNCWNWFRPQDQRREGGEPAILAGIAADVMQAHEIDPQRVFVAGLSAGAAMAVILGRTHPDVFAAVGAHSGLAFGSAHDVGSAFMAMNGGRVSFGGPAAPAGEASLQAAPRTIVFHGDADSTVASRNGEAIFAQAVAANEAAGPLEKKAFARGTARGHDVTRTVYADATGHARVEQWVLHGGTHAWSGGSPAGSYTAPQGPDASAEMVRFFLTHP